MQSCLRLEAAKTKTNVSTQFAYLCFYALLYRTNECCHSLCHVYTSVGVLLVVSLSICASIKWMLESWTFVCTVVLSDRCIRLYYMRLGTNFTYLSSNWANYAEATKKWPQVSLVPAYATACFTPWAYQVDRTPTPTTIKLTLWKCIHGAVTQWLHGEQWMNRHTEGI